MDLNQENYFNLILKLFHVLFITPILLFQNLTLEVVFMKTPDEPQYGLNLKQYIKLKP